jgi:dTDP-4-amino-4,6-dideoxygalactose transaminase
VDKSVCGFSPEDIRLKMAENNIECRPLWKPMHLQPVFENTPYYGKKVAERLFKSGLCLPSGSNLSSEEKLKINDVFMHFIES